MRCFVPLRGLPGGCPSPSGLGPSSRVKSPPADPSGMRPDRTAGGKFPGVRGNSDLECKYGIIGPIKKWKKERK